MAMSDTLRRLVRRARAVRTSMHGDRSIDETDLVERVESLERSVDALLHALTETSGRVEELRRATGDDVP